MSKYQSLTCFLPLMGAEEYGTWIYDRESTGTVDDPITMPWVDYGEVADGLREAIVEFVRSPEGAKSHQYNDVLEANGLSWSAKAIFGADLSELDGVCVVAMMLAILRADRFVEGVYLDALESGWYTKCLQRLEELDAGA